MVPQPTTSATAKMAEPPQIPPSDLVSSLPAPIVRLLILFGRPIAWLRIGIEVLSWKAGRRVESWMIIGAWWGICLGAGHVFKYLLPVALFLPLIPLDRLRLPHVSQNTKKPPPPESTPTRPSTQDTLLHSLSDLHIIYAILPPSPLQRIDGVYSRFAALGPTRLIRGFVILWFTWLSLGWVIGYRSLLALIGSLVLLSPSPALAHTIHLLSKSLLVRRSIALLFLIIFGSPLEQNINYDVSFSVTSWIKGKWAASRRPSFAFAFTPKVDKAGSISTDVVVEEEAEEAGVPIYFKFEVHENQRWWMGLDWTSALLPQERPSWCDSHLLPASPPQSFPLPPSSSITLPSPTSSDPGATTKRTATWKWLDDDWSIIRAGAGQTASPSIPPPQPVSSQANAGYPVSQSPTRSTHTQSASHHTTDEHLGPTAAARAIAEQAFTKGLERFKVRTASPTTSLTKTASPRSSVEISRGRSESQNSDDLHSAIEGVGGSQAKVTAGQVASAEAIVEKDEATDADGWVYGDNKWDNVGPKGGLGKFTRRRRWQRRAICSEIIERIASPEYLQSLQSATTPSSDKTPTGGIPSLTPLKARPVVATEAEIAVVKRDTSLSPTREGRQASVTSIDRVNLGDASIAGSPGGAGRDDVLRQRLKKAMGNVGG